MAKQVNCRRCKRKLKSKASIKRGIGTTCAKKEAEYNKKNKQLYLFRDTKGKFV